MLFSSTAYPLGVTPGHVDLDAQYTVSGTCDFPNVSCTGPGLPFPCCQAAGTGFCNGRIVVDNHKGYAYLANRLASWGYVVISINANRGITGLGGTLGDPAFIFARGRLVLRHLQLLSLASRGMDPAAINGVTPTLLPGTLGGTAPKTIFNDNKLDFSNVGFMGHSRGGEGMRAAYSLYYDGDSTPGEPNWQQLAPRVNIRGIFEIGPTDANGSLVALGTAWNALLPMCDGDVFNLAGMRPFDRMLLQQGNTSEVDSPTQKLTFFVWGANHNFYNTEWQVSDSWGCQNITNVSQPIAVGPPLLTLAPPPLAVPLPLPGAPPPAPTPGPPLNGPMFTMAPGSQTQRNTALASVLAFFRGDVSKQCSDWSIQSGIQGRVQSAGRYRSQADPGGSRWRCRRRRRLSDSRRSGVYAITEPFCSSRV